jgi:hypothetical protein
MALPKSDRGFHGVTLVWLMDLMKGGVCEENTKTTLIASVFWDWRGVVPMGISMQEKSQWVMTVAKTPP